MKRQQKRNERKKGKDPYAAREAKRYETPIASREYLLEILEGRGEPMSGKEIAAHLDIDDEGRGEALTRRLGAMERDGQLIKNRAGAYAPVSKLDLIRGRVIGHSDGFGFLVPDEGGGDLFLSPKQMRRVLHGDRAVARVVGTDRRGRREGAIVEVLQRNTHRVVGRVFQERGVCFVAPDNKRLNQDILIAKGAEGAARHGQIVMADIVEQPTRRSQPIGRIAEVLGDHMDPGMEIDIAIRAHELPLQWPDSVAEEANRIPGEVLEEEKQDRTDIRNLPLVTIDGEDARDFDDAVYCQPTNSGWRLLVAIADVSHYVKPGGALDEEAHARGNSVYFPERVVPMLPEALSNGLCSLNPHVDRLCMVCEMLISTDGEVRRSSFFAGVMHSHARLTYEEVWAALSGGSKSGDGIDKELIPHLRELNKMYRAMHRARERRGAIDFDVPEAMINFGKDRKIESIVTRTRNDAHRIIEECMIAANVCSARFLRRQKMPTLYRVHEGPTAEKLEDLREFLGEFGLTLKGRDKPSAKDYARLLEQVKERPDFHLLQTVMLRSMAQARYSPENLGHFGLSLPEYLHFTSPIRRYPDVLVHRAIRHVLERNPPRDFAYQFSDLEAIGEHCSASERRADEATGDAIDWLKCEYMMDKIGETFGGIISGVTGFGLFVELEGIFVEGLIHVTALKNDFYHFDPVRHWLTGERSGSRYRLGDRIKVRVLRVDLDERKIDFEVVEEQQRRVRRGHGTRKGAKRARGKKR